MSLFYFLEKTPNTTTDNGMLAHSSTGSLLVDLFADLGACKKETDSSNVDKFISLYREDAELALRLLFWVRDCRGGCGRKAVFNQLLGALVSKKLLFNYSIHPSVGEASKIKAVLSMIVKVGSYKDIVVLFNNLIQNSVQDSGAVLVNNIILNFYKDSLCDEQTKHLAGKWFPRNEKDKFNKAYRSYFKLKQKELRKIIVSATNYVVEHHMSKNNFDGIVFSKVPSRALHMYRKSFQKKSSDAFQRYKKDVVDGKEKAKTTSLYPHEIIKQLDSYENDSSYLNALWLDFVNKVQFNKPVVPVVDLSGSMQSAGVYHIACALGMLFAQANKNEAFKDKVMSFASSPSFVSLSGDVLSRYEQLGRSQVGYSTDILKLFRVLLRCATQNKVQQEDMPSHLVILSDMQFNCGDVENHSSFLPIITSEYANHGYKPPTLVFWNLTSRGVYSTYHALHDEKGVIKLSGFSHSLFDIVTKEGFSSDSITPLGVALATLNKERYLLEA